MTTTKNPRPLTPAMITAVLEAVKVSPDHLNSHTGQTVRYATMEALVTRGIMETLPYDDGRRHCTHCYTYRLTDAGREWAREYLVSLPSVTD